MLLLLPICTAFLAACLLLLAAACCCLLLVLVLLLLWLGRPWLVSFVVATEANRER